MSGERELPSGPGGFLGPVEPGEGTWTPLVLRPEPPPERPPRLLSRRQKCVLASLLLLLALGLTIRHAVNYPGRASGSPPPGQLPPSPSQSTRFEYDGPAPAGSDSFALRLAVRNTGPVPVDVLGVSQGYRGLTVRVSGWLPRTVPPGGTLSLRVGLEVVDCSGASADASLPFLDVTLRNTRAMETVRQILGTPYAGDLSAALHSACDVTDYRTSATTAQSADKPVR